MSTQIMFKDANIGPRTIRESARKALPSHKMPIRAVSVPKILPSSCPDDVGIIGRMLSNHWQSRIEALVYWKNVNESSIIFILGLIGFGVLLRYNVIAVLSHIALAFLTAALALKFLSRVRGRQYIISKWPNFDNLEQSVVKTVDGAVKVICAIRDIFLVKDLYNSLRFAFVLYILTWIDIVFSGYNFLLSIFFGIFTVPKALELLQPTLKKLAKAARKEWEKTKQYCKSKLNIWESTA